MSKEKLKSALDQKIKVRMWHVEANDGKGAEVEATGTVREIILNPSQVNMDDLKYVMHLALAAVIQHLEEE